MRKRLVGLSAIILMGLITMAGKNNGRTFSVELKAPDSAWSVHIDRIGVVNGEIWVLAGLSRGADAIGMQRITTIRDAVQVEAPDLPVSFFVFGKTWKWKNTEPYVFLKERAEIESKLGNAEWLYRRSAT
jgi:hypothetical protein